MADEIGKIMKTEDSDLAYEAVIRETKQDLGGLITEYDRHVRAGQLPQALKVQWAIVKALTSTLVRVERRARLMDQDYKRGR